MSERITKITPEEDADLRALLLGPRGGRLRGKRRPTAEDADRALAHWPKSRRTQAIVAGILMGVIR